MSDGKIMKRIGVIGFGKMGMLHSGIINAFNDSEIVAVSESSSFICKYASKIMPQVKFYTDYIDMIKNEELDGIIITTPVGLHAEMMNNCYQNNLSMLVEKPLCRDLNELNFSVNGLINKDISIVTGYCLLFKDTFVEAEKWLSKKIIGEVLWSKGFINVQQVFRQSSNWQYKKESAGGGVMMGLSSHLISALVNFFGKEKEVLGMTRNHFCDDVEDVGLAVIKFENDVLCSIESSWSKYNSRLPKATVEINGEYGQIIVDETELKIFLSEDRHGLKSGWTRLTQADLFKGVEFDIGGAEFTNQDRFFINSLKKGNDSWLENFEISTSTQRIIGKIYG